MQSLIIAFSTPIDIYSLSINLSKYVNWPLQYNKVKTPLTTDRFCTIKLFKTFLVPRCNKLVCFPLSSTFIKGKVRPACHYIMVNTLAYYRVVTLL
jgi:hypothetical protein